MSMIIDKTTIMVTAAMAVTITMTKIMNEYDYEHFYSGRQWATTMLNDFVST